MSYAASQAFELTGGRYFRMYSSHLPIFDMNLYPSDYYSNSPLIFWCILTVGSRRHAEDSTLLASLIARVMEVVMSSLFTISPEVKVVEEILLLLTWLFPSTPKCGENIFVMRGNLVHVAMRLGLHMPLSSQNFARTKPRLSDQDLKRRPELWSYCFHSMQGPRTFWSI